MGCSYSPTPKELAYHAVDYSKVEVIQGLLRFYNDFKVQARKDMNTELVAIYLDLENAMKSVELPVRQQQAKDLYIKGWTEEEIGSIMDGITHQAVHKLIIKVCKKYSKFLSEKGLQSSKIIEGTM